MSPRLASAKRRESIIAAAIPVFARKGFAGTTTREIAEAVGVSEGLLFKYFASKTALYEAMIATCTRVSPAFARIQQRPPGTDALVETVEMILRHFAGFDVERENYEWSHRLFLRSLLEDGEFARTALRGVQDTLLGLFSDSYNAARRAGDLVDDAGDAAAAFWFLMHSALMLGSMALSDTKGGMTGYSYREMVRGTLRGIGLRDDVIAHQAEPTVPRLHAEHVWPAAE
jgi:AcrR family transcriptional regulator